MTDTKKKALSAKLQTKKEHSQLARNIREHYGWYGDHIKENESPEDKIFGAFLEDCYRYARAIRDGRVFCIIHSVSRSGMSRVMSFHESARYDQRLSDGRTHCFLSFYSLFNALGYSESGEGFRISGCGMDMVFATNYNVIHSLKNIGVLNKAQCAKLSQATPTHF